MRVLWINEELIPPAQEYTQIFNFEDFKTEIDCNGLPDEIWFGIKEGYECAEYLVKYCSERNYATPRYHLQQMKLEDARKIIYLIEDYNLNYIREHGISEEDLIKHFIDIIGNTNIEDIGSITYAINKHEKELDSLANIKEDIRKEFSDSINSDNASIIADITTQFVNYDKAIKEYIKANKFAKESQLPTKLSQLENDEGYLKEHQDVSNLANKSEIPTKLSQLENDEGYLKEQQDISNLITKEEFDKKLSYKANKIDLVEKASYKEIPKKISQLENDLHFTNISDIPTKVSQLENDSNYVTMNNVKNKADKSFVIEALVDYATVKYVNLRIDNLLKDYILIKKPKELEDGEYKIVIEEIQK